MVAIIAVGTFQLPAYLKKNFNYYNDYIQKLSLEDLDLLVCPPDTIGYFKSYDDYLLFHRELAISSSCTVAPGFFLKDKYNTAILITAQGEIIHEQHQVHLSQKELDQGLKRGSSLEVVDTPIGRIGFMIGVDCFYPVVGRILGLQKVDIVIAYYKQLMPNNPWLQFSGVWQQVQHNQFFAVENVVNSTIDEAEFTGKTIIHCPLCSDYKEGCVEQIEPYENGGFIKATFDVKKIKQIIQEFPIYRYFNCALYEKMWGNNDDKNSKRF